MGINVLSLFDGMSCAQIALQQLGIKVNMYFAAEIDKHAIKVTQDNFPNTIQIGDVTKIKIKSQYENGEQITVIEYDGGSYSIKGRIDLLCGGSPCQGFSFAGKQLNFEDPRIKLFFEYSRILNEINPN